MQGFERYLLNKIIVVVDDEPEMLAMVATILRGHGFTEVKTFPSPTEALDFCRKVPVTPHLLVLDVMMPELDGLALLREIRSLPGQERMPAIFLTARDEPTDRLNGLGLGADDYIGKPFLPEEFVLRLAAVLRRCYSAEEDLLDLGFATVDLENAEVMRPDGSRTLTAKEHDILAVLAQNRGRIVTFDTIIEACWESNFGYENTLMAHVRRLREKIEEDPSNPQALTTVKGLGYRLKVQG